MINLNEDIKRACYNGILDAVLFCLCPPLGLLCIAFDLHILVRGGDFS